MEFTGLSKLVLHAWERRFGLVSPERSETGRRRYSREEVMRLRLLKLLTDSGHRIGKIAHLDQNALRAMLSERGQVESFGPLLSAIESLDNVEMDRILNAHFLTLGPVDFSRQIVLPLMREVGRRWANKSMSVASEHLVSASIRWLLGNSMKLMPAPHRRLRIVFCTAEGEMHEMGVLIATVLALAHGVHTLYLGPDMPAQDIADAAAKADADIVCLAATVGKPAHVVNLISHIRQSVSDRTEIWIGGPAWTGEQASEGLRYLPSLEAFEAAIQEKLAG
ncbi:MerR family transcriptional regulator [Allorhizobium sp. BGMRC 0089]|nr:MerR family transcriptional regulator [Allorhizobium sonneratiae]